MKRSRTGSCHCGEVRFEADVDLTQVTSRCNCSICFKSRFWKTVVKAEAFRLLQGKEKLTDYQFGSGVIHHMFCRRCGVKVFGRGHLEEFGEFYAINVACLDDVTDEELAHAAVKFEDGRNNKWESTPVETRHL